MKKLVNALGIAMIIASVVVIICTFLTSYQFIYLGDMFTTYFTLQVCLGITMGLWAIKFWLEELGTKKYIYPLICLGISFSSVFFILSAVR